MVENEKKETQYTFWCRRHSKLGPTFLPIIRGSRFSGVFHRRVFDWTVLYRRAKRINEMKSTHAHGRWIPNTLIVIHLVMTLAKTKPTMNNIQRFRCHTRLYEDNCTNVSGTYDVQNNTLAATASTKSPRMFSPFMRYQERG